MTLTTLTKGPPMATATLPMNGTGGTLLTARLDEGLRVEVMTIPPDLAAKWLKRNRVNRALKQRHVDKLVRAIQAGAWDDLNGATIVFSDEQDLLDGQHRLTAVVQAQQSITTLVVFGVQARKRASIDTGAGRLLRDYLSMQSHPNATNLSAALTVLYAWEKKCLVANPYGRGLFVHYTEALTFLEAHAGFEHSVSRAKRLPRLLVPSQAAVLDYLFSTKDLCLRDAWYDTLHSGHLTPPYQVFLTLRERLIRDKMDGIKRHPLEQFVYNLKAWNAARQGRLLKVFTWHQNEPLPELR